jgi:hypothetical protein
MKQDLKESFNFEIARELSKKYNTIESKYILINTLQKYYTTKNITDYKNWEIKSLYNHILINNYPNETSIKSQFINQKLFNGKTHVTIFELPISKSRIDLCKINGKSIAYEIKTDLDNFNRLEKQLNDYFKFFDEVFVICSINNLTKIEKIIPKKTGIYTYKITKNKKYIFKKEKECQRNFNINSKEQLIALTNRELASIIKTNNLEFSREKAIDIILESKKKDQINTIFKRSIKARYHNQWNFLKQNHENILELDYQWFFKNTVKPQLIYQKSF